MSQLSRVHFLVLASLVVFVAPGSAGAPEKSLDNCQAAVHESATIFLNATLEAIGACFNEISAEIIVENNLIADPAAKKCATELRKLADSRPGEGLHAELFAEIERLCDPVRNAHTLDDILGSGFPAALEPIFATDLGQFCTNFGGDGSIDSLDEWMDCLIEVHEAAADQAIAVQYPRAVEWLELVRPAISTLPVKKNDPTEINDALTALDSLSTALQTELGLWDGDGDGYSPVHGDCDDDNFSVYPGAEEYCDGLDNDCDDTIDNNVAQVVCLLQDGVCAGSIRSCVLGDYTGCGPQEFGPDYEPSEVTCDGLDNDCNGMVDDIVEPPRCPLQLGVCNGSVARCGGVEGYLPCSEEEYGPEYQTDENTCDGLDNDCDGLVDEGQPTLGFPCYAGEGECVRGGYYACSDAGTSVACNATPGPASSEVCDGVDNDCDGITDNNLAPAFCLLQHGVCAGSVKSCGGALGLVDCGRYEYGSLFEPIETSCDGSDNDCDGVVDEDCQPPPIP